jgi:C-terminal processing protease CtpA/Prc
MKYFLNHRPFLFIFFIAINWSCKDKEEALPAPVLDPKEITNNWILDVMSEVYYWLDDLGKPIDKKSDPEDFFEALLNRPTDRFSVIYPDYQELINGLSGISLEAGYEFQLYRQSSTSNNVIAEISYIKKNSPAALAGLKRGDVIQKINGSEMTIDNFREILGLREKQHTLTYISFDEGLNGFVSKPDVSLTPIQLAENPNFLDTIYTIGNQKIGYVVYHFFAPGSGEGNTSYDQEMDAIFANFKTSNINHLIIDFRYNGGGYVSSAVNLASLIAPGVNQNTIFSKTKYNSVVIAAVPELKDAKTAFKSKTQNLGNILSGNKVYILTSSRTASASELIINGLKPYMDIFLIGDKTTGKNVGSIALEDEKNPSNKYGLLPIVSQSFNSLDQSDYSTGFIPNITLKESTERLRPLGDTNELLLRTAISQITGTPPTGRFQQLDRLDVGSSLDSKIRSGHQIETFKMNF